MKIVDEGKTWLVSYRGHRIRMKKSDQPTKEDAFHMMRVTMQAYRVKL